MLQISATLPLFLDILFKSEFIAVFGFLRAAAQQWETNLPFGVSCLRRVTLPSAAKSPKRRPRRSPLGIPLKANDLHDVYFRHEGNEQAKRLPRSSASAEIHARLLPFYRSALNFSGLIVPASGTGTPKQRRKASNMIAGAAAGQPQDVSGRACRKQNFNVHSI